MSEASAQKPKSETGLGSIAAVVGKLVIAVAIVMAATEASKAFIHFVDVRFQDGVTVAGSAKVRIQSDRAIWGGSLTSRGTTLIEAYQGIREGMPKVLAQLKSEGVSEKEIAVGAVETDVLYARNEEGHYLQDQVIGYVLSQPVTVTTDNVELVSRVAQSVTQLIEAGLQIQSGQPSYIYTEIGDTKVQLVGEATADARNRAEQVAKNSGATLGPLLHAKVGVIQVNAANESQVSWDGMNDRTSVEKDVMVVVRTKFLLR